MPYATNGPIKNPTPEYEMRRRAGDIESEENRRYGEGVGIAKDAYAKSESALSSLIDPSLLFSKAADAIGARGAANINALRSSAGARGLNPNSGAVQGMLSRMAFDTNNSVVGATRDIALDQQKQRQVNAAQSFASAMNLAGLVNAPVSQIGLDTEQNLFEGNLTREGIAAQKKASKDANKTDLLGGLIKLGGGILSGLAL